MFPNSKYFSLASGILRGALIYFAQVLDTQNIYEHFVTLLVESADCISRYSQLPQEIIQSEMTSEYSYYDPEALLGEV